VDGWTGQEGKGGRSGNVKIYVKLFHPSLSGAHLSLLYYHRIIISTVKSYDVVKAAVLLRAQMDLVHCHPLLSADGFYCRFRPTTAL
jgi:hypothetical protein